MSVTGFWIDRAIAELADAITQLPCAPGVQFSKGDACSIDVSTSTGTAGLLIQAPAQTTSPRYILLSVMAQTAQSFPGIAGNFPSGPLRQATYNLSVSSANGGSVAEVIDCGIAPQLILSTQFAAATFEGSANTNSTANNVLFTSAGSSNAYDGGTLYCNETGQQFTIVSDTVSGGVHTVTIFPTPAAAITSTNTIRVVPWGAGYVGGVKLQPTSNFQQGISTVLGDATGGHILIHSVDLATRIARVRFSGSGILAV